MELKQKIKKFVARELGVRPDEIDDNATLSFDSLGIVELSMALEDEFDISISDHDYPQLDTINKIEKFIKDATPVS